MHCKCNILMIYGGARARWRLSDIDRPPRITRAQLGPRPLAGVLLPILVAATNLRKELKCNVSQFQNSRHPLYQVPTAQVTQPPIKTLLHFFLQSTLGVKPPSSMILASSSVESVGIDEYHRNLYEVEHLCGI